MMALLHFSNLAENRPDLLMQRAFFSLKPFYDFLDNTRKFMESDAAVLRLACTPDLSVHEKKDGEAEPTGVWVLLEEPADRPNEPDSTFRAFMDENLDAVYESESPQALSSDDKPRQSGRLNFDPARKIAVLERDPQTNRLLLERRPGSSTSNLLIRPNTLTIKRQIEALQGLQNTPSQAHLPLLRLLQAKAHALWPTFAPTALAEDAWLVLRDAERAGTAEQRHFVELALATPDFALLEGPPGSGKTTAICELVLQLLKQGKRVLLCASTHVAVDNVLERLMDKRNEERNLIIPIRVGDAKNISENAQPWQLKNFLQTERKRLLSELERVKSRSQAQEDLFSVISHHPSAFERMVLDAANLVCGTTIGILQHPDIKNGDHSRPEFDVLILDEASKTPFQEFLVPARLAKRWVIVGDPKQLSPFVDEVALATNLSACLPDSICRRACLDVFLALQENENKRRIAVVAYQNEKERAIYQAQAIARKLDFATPSSEELAISSAAMVLGSQADLARCEAHLPLDVSNLRALPNSFALLGRRMAAWARGNDRRLEAVPEWSEEISWRLARVYEQRFASEENFVVPIGVPAHKSTAQRLREQVEQLLPVEQTGSDPEQVMRDIDMVRRIAMPSILELLRYGFERNAKDKSGSSLTDGLLPEVLQSRHVLLSTQHRMHPEIAAFSHLHIYHEQALHTPAHMEKARAWSYLQYSSRAMWLDVRGNCKGNASPSEANAIVRELMKFEQWAKQNRHTNEGPWQVAVLAFYREQERLLRQHLREWSGQHAGMQHFYRGDKSRPYLCLDLCTVDRFQGHEADLVFISIANNHVSSFLASPNRLNVALTRARFQRVVVGDRSAIEKSKSSLLGKLAAHEQWMQQMGGRHV